MHSLREFLATGQIGSISLGVGASSLMAEVGEPDEISAKTNPLLVRYGGITLMFWRARTDKVPKLREISIDFTADSISSSDLIRFSDWPLVLPPVEQWLLTLASEDNFFPLLATEGANERRLVFPSGVVAVVQSGTVQALRMAERDVKSQPNLELTDDREPTETEIHAMLAEAKKVADVGANQAAFLVGWAALEATLRHLALRQGLGGKVGSQPLVLLRELSAAGVLSKDETRLLEEFRRIRSASAHGLTPQLATLKSVRSLLDIADALRKRIARQSASSQV